jgi:hypothetical protein
VFIVLKLSIRRICMYLLYADLLWQSGDEKKLKKRGY